MAKGIRNISIPDFYSGGQDDRKKFLETLKVIYKNNQGLKEMLLGSNPTLLVPYVTALYKDLEKSVFRKSHLNESLLEYNKFKEAFSPTLRQQVFERFVDFLIKKGEFELAFREWKSLQIETKHPFESEWSYNSSSATPRFIQFEFNLKMPLVKGIDIYRFSYANNRFTEFGEKNRTDILGMLDEQLNQVSPESFFNDLFENYGYNTPWKELRTKKINEYAEYKEEFDLRKRLPPESITASGRISKWAIGVIVEEKASYLLRKSENDFRLSIGGKKVGESWISETELFYRLKEAFPETRVVHHGRPHFLGRQHFDVWLPDLAIAIEYQGEQHDKPIEFFGGEEGYQKNVERDLRKRNVAKENGIDLIEVRPGYSMELLINRINEIRGWRLSREK